MGPPTVMVRCPSCGQPLQAFLAPAPPTQWFPCPHCRVPVPVVVPRDLPPLYSWEVVPGLYPRLGFPRTPRWRPARVAAIALVAAAVLAAASAGFLGYEGLVAAQPAQYTVWGTVSEDRGNGLLLPVNGALVNLSVNGAYFAQTTTNAQGKFDFLAVPAGGLELNVSAVGYGPTVVNTFASRAYSTQTGGLGITLEPGGPSNLTTTALTPFGDLETFLAYTGGAAVLLAGAAGTTAAGAYALRRSSGGAFGVVGASAAVAVPLVLVVLSLGTVFPYVTVLAGVVGGVGAFALVLTAAQLAGRGSSVDPA